VVVSVVLALCRSGAVIEQASHTGMQTQDIAVAGEACLLQYHVYTSIVTVVML
jgi:hypothetical protein